MPRLLPHFPHYFKTRLPLQIGELYLSSAIMDFASAAIALFEPIYLWTIGYRIQHIMVFYLILYLAYYVLVPLGGKFIARFGHERSILISTFWLVLYFVALMGIAHFSILFYFAPLFFALQKTFYWPAYHFDFLRFSEKHERGTEFSALWSITTVMYVLGPIIGGIVVKFFGFTPLFLGACVVILLSSMPLFATKTKAKPEAFSYWKSFVLPFRRRYWRNTVGYLALGEELVLMTIWPIFILLVFHDLFDVGLLVGASAFLTAIATLFVGKWTDKTAKHHVLNTGGIATAAAWLIRLFAQSAPGVFLLDTVSRISRNTTYVSMTTMTYDRAHEDDYSWHGVYYEQGFAIAKSLIAILIIGLAGIADPFQTAFVLSALVSLFYLVF